MLGAEVLVTWILSFGGGDTVFPHFIWPIQLWGIFALALSPNLLISKFCHVTSTLSNQTGVIPANLRTRVVTRIDLHTGQNHLFAQWLEGKFGPLCRQVEGISQTLL